ncbi:hypothetical protein, partial [Myxococcus xanthus]|uniref:hypothetical protein n=1 Tax=Myxococcus xanthus TaxID=34 RepID=UPI002649C8F9
HSYFGKSEWEDFAPGLKTLEQATELRRRILSAFEQAENERDAAPSGRPPGRRAQGHGSARVPEGARVPGCRCCPRRPRRAGPGE